MSSQKVIICKDLKAELSKFLESVKYDKLFVLTDTNTLELCFPLLKGVPQLQDAPVITVDAGDTNKNIEQVSSIWMRLCNEGASRNSLLLNVGGGMITDMGGFAAATFKRGIYSVNIPTTLMASVDAAVGGKTGINFNGLKNRIFHHMVCKFNPLRNNFYTWINIIKKPRFVDCLPVLCHCCFGKYIPGLKLHCTHGLCNKTGVSNFH